MMWLVRLALNRPYTFVVMAILIVLLAGVSIWQTPTDIFPEIDIPIISIIWTYRGMDPAEMEKRITTFSENSIGGNVNDIRRIESIESIQSMPVPVAGRSEPELLSNFAKVERCTTPEVINHVDIQPVCDVYAGVQGRDLGSVARDINRVLDEFRSQLGPGNTLTIRGQVSSMESAFVRLGIGLILAAALVYLLMVVNFQSWLDPLIIITALPGALVGIIWMLFATRTTFSVPSLMGAIMAIGVATANSILMVTFANSQRRAGKDSIASAIEAGRTRMRPVLMTALAMVIGMLPMSLGLGEGGEQNAPLGRAVIGGLVLATLATLLFVPVVYSVLRKHSVPLHDDEGEEEAAA